jgi:uncharacterized RDD family membrane protein YckC
MTEELRGKYASFWERFFAFIVDFLVLLIFGGLLRLVYVLLGTSLAKADPSTQALGACSQIFILFLWFASCAAYFVAFWTRYGQTPGKMVVGLKVVLADGAPLTLNEAFIRVLGYFTVWLLFPMIAFDSRKQGLHDKMASTYVIRI